MHPYLPQLALTSYSGAVHVWDYDTKQLLLVRVQRAPCSSVRSFALCGSFVPLLEFAPWALCPGDLSMPLPPNVFLHSCICPCFLVCDRCGC